MSDGEDSEFIAGLRSDLESHLIDLENESKLIRRALRALGRADRRRRPPQESLVEALRQMPDSRPSVLAMARGTSVETVIAELHALEREGIAVKQGERWSLVAVPPR